jgi:ectoine hydroxylase-related dioxygenase (phytanoyl-CoA dioxygenase family)
MDAPELQLDALVDRWQPRLPDDDVRTMLTSWLEDGYVIVDGCYPEADVDAFAAEVDAAWFANVPYEDLFVSDVDDGGMTHVHVAHRELITWPIDVRIAAMERSNWRIGEFNKHNTAAERVFRNERMRLLCSMLLDRDAQPQYSLTFSKGSRQGLHQDTCVFHVWPKNALIGVWIALEDIAPDSGPLVYCPGSHREPLFAEFDNYPQTQRRTSAPDVSRRYDSYVTGLAEDYSQERFIAKRGQALLWHGMLIHGGAQDVTPGTTRKSFVIHYMPDGSNVAHDMTGPFNW